MDVREDIQALLNDPERLLQKKPFTRGADRTYFPRIKKTTEVGETIQVNLPKYRRYNLPQEQYLRELDCACHDVLFDENIPSICVKLKDGSYSDIRFEKTSLPIQQLIKNKQLMHLAANRMQFTLTDINPTDVQQLCYTTFKQYWDLRNQDGMKWKMVDTQLSVGDAGLLYYFDRYGCIKSRIISFPNYVLCPHNDQNGDRLLETIYYMNGNDEIIDNYDDEYLYRIIKNEDSEEWQYLPPIKHGFNEIPLVTKRGQVAWDKVQSLINSYEILYNIFNAIQKRYGWGIFYIRGRFKDDGKRIAGSVVLNDTNPEGKGDAKFLTPPTPQGMLDTLNLIMESIQLGSSTTFLLPKDIKTGGDISGITIQLVQSMDIESAMSRVVEWQNVADKMVRLFKYGLSKELVNKGIMPTAITDFEKLNINAKFKVWKPLNDYEFNQMITMLYGAGVISKETAVEMNTMSKPDEKARITKEQEETILTNQNININNNDINQ